MAARPDPAAAAVAAEGEAVEGEPAEVAEVVEPPEVEGDAEGEAGEEANVSLAAMEQELLPSVIETFDKIAATFKKLDKLLVQAAGDLERRRQADARRARTQDRRS